MVEREIPKNAKLIPPEAKKVFEGVIFDVFQWEQKLFDGSYATFEMLRRPDTVLVIAVDEEDKIIALREEQPGHAIRELRLPGGRVDPALGSTLEAAKHELLEETGLEFSKWRLVEVVQPEVKIEWFIHVFLAEGIVARRELAPDAGERILEVKRIPYEDFRLDNFDVSRVKILQRCKTIDEVRQEQS